MLYLYECRMARELKVGQTNKHLKVVAMTVNLSPLPQHIVELNVPSVYLNSANLCKQIVAILSAKHALNRSKKRSAQFAKTQSSPYFMTKGCRHHLTICKFIVHIRDVGVAGLEN